MISYLGLALLFVLAMLISHFLGFLTGRNLGMRMTVEVTAEMQNITTHELALKLKNFTAKRIREEEAKVKA